MKTGHAGTGPNGTLQPEFLALLRCPAHPVEGVLEALSTGLKCRQCSTVYPIRKGIPDFVDVTAPDPRLADESRQWDDQAEKYDAARLTDAVYRACLEATIAALAPERGEVILDAACGTGLTVRRYHQLCAGIVAADLSLESLRRLQTANLDNVWLVRADVSASPFATGRFDHVLCANVLQHLPTPELRARTIGELARCAAPGRRVVVTAHGFSRSKRRRGWKKEGTPGGGQSGHVSYIYRFEPEEFRALLNAHLAVNKVIGIGMPLPDSSMLRPVLERMERLAWSFPALASLGHMLLGVGASPETR